MKKMKKTRLNINQPPRGNRNNMYARARIDAGLTQGDACQKLHISTQLLSDIENDKYNPTPDIALGMGKLYNDGRLPKKTCREVCAIGRAKALPFNLNLEVVIPLMNERFDEIQSILKELPHLIKNQEVIQDFSPGQWERLMEFAIRKVRDFARDLDILEVSIDRLLEQEEKKTACAAKR